MAAKKRPSRAAKATETKKKKAKAPAKKAAPVRNVAVTGQSLRLAVKQADVRVRRAAEAYVEKATELEAARIKLAEAERELGASCADQAAREKRPFFNFLAQGDSWFRYTCGSAIIDGLKALFGPKNAYFENIAASGRTVSAICSRATSRTTLRPAHRAVRGGAAFCSPAAATTSAAIPASEIGSNPQAAGRNPRTLHHPRLRPRTRHAKEVLRERDHARRQTDARRAALRPRLRFRDSRRPLRDR